MGHESGRRLRGQQVAAIARFVKRSGAAPSLCALFASEVAEEDEVIRGHCH